MGEIEKISGSLVGGIPTGPGESTKKVSWNDGKDWIWHDISELPDYILVEFHKQYLFPNEVFFSIVKEPIVEYVNGVPTYHQITGWIAGDSCFTEFTLRKHITESNDKYKLSAKRNNFIQSVEKLETLVSPDSPEIARSQTEVSKNGKSEHPFENGKYLPQRLQKLLASVPNHEFLSSYIQQTSNPEARGYIKNEVHVTIYNNVHCVSIKATRLFKGSEGMTEENLVSKLEESDWRAEIVRGFFR